jgi:hypothetical protein
MHEERTQKSPLKNTLWFGKYKKDKFLTKIVFVRNLSFLYFPKYNIFFNGTFLHTLLLYVSIYIFNVIIFRNIKI